MKSRLGTRFCHDEDAAGYDQDVRNEVHPVRKGYAEALAWLASQVPEGSSVLDLGCGTGNTILALPKSCPVTAVDISPSMLQIAAQKLAGRSVRFVLSDMMQFFDREAEPIDVIVSSYAIHHLPDDEKSQLFDLFSNRLHAGGRAVIVDLMFKNQLDRAAVINRYSHSYPDLVKDAEAEFFWNLETAEPEVIRKGFTVSLTKFSDLSWGVLATKESENDGKHQTRRA